MVRGWSLLAGAGLGAGLMFFFDPDRGRRRRALATDKTVRWRRKVREAAGATSRDLRNRAQGTAATVGSWVMPEGFVADEVVAERVRAALGLVTRHPSTIEVEVRNGVATVRGPVLSQEAAGVLAAVRDVHGVTHIENRLDLHETPRGIPALQGGAAARSGPRWALLQRHWSPTARASAMLAGITAIGGLVNRRNVARGAFAIAGLALCLRAVLNRDLVRDLVDIGASIRKAARPRVSKPDKEGRAPEPWQQAA